MIPREAVGQRSETVRRANLSAIVREFHVRGPLSRSDLVALTGLTRSAIRGLIGELAAGGLVREERSEPAGTPGRPSPLVRPDVVHAGRSAAGGREAVAALLEAAAAGEPEALAGLAHVGKWLGIGLAGLINVLNPSLVVLGGLFERIHPFVSDQLADVLERRALPPPASSCPSCPAHSAWTQRWVPRSTHSNRCWPIRRLGSPSSAPDGRRWRALDVMAASGSIAPVSSVSDLEAQRGGA